MSYYTQCRGIIDIDPPVPWGKIKDSPFLPSGDDRLDLVLVMMEVAVDTDQGTLIQRTATGVKQRWDSDPGNRNIIKQLQQLINALPDHNFVGRFNCEGEENGDLWRLEVHDRRAVRVAPRIIWPDGTEEEMRDHQR